EKTRETGERVARRGGCLPSRPRNMTLVQAAGPVIDLALGLIPTLAVALLDASDQLVALAGDDFQIVIRQLAPPLADLAHHLFPVSLDAIPVHRLSPRSI